MTTPYGLTPAGYVPPRALDLLALSRGDFEDAVNGGAPYDWDADEVLGVLTAIWAVRAGSLSEGVLQALADALDINNASGALLDIAVQSYGLNRRPATQGVATLTATISSTPVFVPLGTRFGQVYSATQLLVWTAAEDTTLTTTGDTILVTCSEPGVYVAGAGTITKILDNVPGLTSVTNASSASPGLAEQVDQDLRLDALRLLQAPSRGTLGAMYASAVRAVPAGTFVGVLENRATTATTIDGKSVPAIGSAVVVYPALTAANAQSLRESIFAVKPLGGAIGGDQTGTVVGPDGEDNTVGFYYASTLPVTVAVATTLESGVVLGDVSAAVATAVETHMARLRVGDDVLRLGLCAAIATVEGVRSAVVSLNGSSAADVTVGLATIALLNGSVTVT